MLRKIAVFAGDRRLEFNLQTANVETHSFVYDHLEIFEKAERAFRAAFLEGLASVKEKSEPNK